MQSSHDFHGNVLSGNSRAHLGNNVITNNYNQDSRPERGLSDLPSAAQAAFDSSSMQDEALCLEDTRIDVLKQIRAWTLSNEASRILWLNGMAGTGKSTIARTIAHEFHERGCLGASFFFSRGGGDTGRANLLITTIAKQLAISRPAVRQHILDAIDSEPEVVYKSRQQQWKKLIAEPLEKLEPNAAPRELVFVIDALDECDRDDDIKGIISMFSLASHITSVILRIIVTSRPEIPIRLGLRNIPSILHHDLHLHNVPREFVDSDICLFFYARFGEIKLEREWLTEEWPGIDTINRLVRLSAGLFIFAATVCRFIEEDYHATEDDFDRMIVGFESPQGGIPDREDRDTHMILSLDVVYTQVLHRSFKGSKSTAAYHRALEATRKVLGALAVLQSPLCLDHFAIILGAPNSEICVRLNGLHSVVHIASSGQSPVSFCHLSFRDFLLDKTRCIKAAEQSDIVDTLGGTSDDPVRFWIDPKPMHTTLAERCLWILSQPGVMREDLYNLDAPGVMRKELAAELQTPTIEPDVAYACCYWGRHILEAGEQVQDESSVHKFLTLHLLHWLEAMSWLDRLSEAVTCLIGLQSLVEGQNHVSRFLSDARQFLMANRNMIDTAPLQVYKSALVFAPTKSEVRQTFRRHIDDLLEVAPQVPLAWPSELTLKGHTGEVDSLCFSTCGTRILSDSTDGTTRLWDATTGEELQTFRIGSDFHDRAPSILSPTGSTVATSDGYNRIHLWDTDTGMQIKVFDLEGNQRTIILGFLPSCKSLLLWSGYEHLERLDIDSGARTDITRLYSLSDVVRFAPDALLVACGDIFFGPIRILDATSGSQLSQINMPDRDSCPFTFHPRGQLLACASQDGRIDFYSVTSGQRVQIFEGPKAEISHLVFSSEGAKMVRGEGEEIRY